VGSTELVAYILSVFQPPSDLRTQDCGDRAGERPATSTCSSKNCIPARDGECDDGGTGSISHACAFGTDCMVNFYLRLLPLRKNKLVTFLLCCPFQDCGDREGQSSPSATSCVDTEDFVDEIGDTCDSNAGYDCAYRDFYINTWGYSPEGWKELLRNCLVSCDLCDSGASRRHLEDDLSSDPCVCMPTWGGGGLVKVNPTCANQRGCPASACDNDPIGPWCEVVNLGCATAEGDGSWAYCSPGTTVVPTEF
jgi:hypothetical protein